MSPEDWLARAESSLNIAKFPYENSTTFPEDLCYQAQQAAEKAIKSVYVFHGQPHRFTHDIAALLDGLEQSGIKVPTELECAVSLSCYAVSARYPNLGEFVSKEELALASSAAERTIAWARIQLLTPEV